jgi:hypothetical protein
MSDTDRQLGRAEQELRQAMDALKEAKREISGAVTTLESCQTAFHPSPYQALVLREKVDDLRRAMTGIDHVLALYARRRIGTECAAVGRDVLLAGLGVDRG